jgi:hypothetical protein
MASLLSPAVPQINVPPVDYDQNYQNQLNNVLRLYFNQLNSVVAAIIQNINTTQGIAGAGQISNVSKQSVAISGQVVVPFTYTNQTFIGFLVVGCLKNATTRTTTTYSVFYVKGDSGATFTQIATANGSAGGNSFTLSVGTLNNTFGIIITNNASNVSDINAAIYGSVLQ